MVRNNRVNIILSNEKKRKLKNKAERHGLTISQYVRMISLNAIERIKENKK